MNARSARVAAALRLVARRRTRSGLAALGAAATLASLLVAVAVAERGRRDALDEIQRMGATVLTVSAQDSRSRGGRQRTGGVVTTLRLQDARDIERLVPGVTLVAGEYRGVAPVKVADLARQATIAGIEPSYARLRQSPMRAGRFFDESDDAQAQRVAVLGARLARDLYGDRDVVGEQIRVRGIPFVVIGLLAERGTGLDAFDEDEVVFVPLKTARRRLFQVDYVQRLFIRADASADVGTVGATVAALLRGTHPTTATDAPDFRVQDQRRLVSLRETTIARLGAFQWIVAGVLLTAGAAGVFALQFLSVRERRSEVGTRRAVGATRGVIFAQFVAEAAVITVIGGMLGVIIGMFGAGVAGVRVSVPVAIAAFSASCIAGIAAAFEPARRAAHLPPAVAFRGQ